MAFPNEYHGNMHVLTQTMRSVPLEVIPDLGLQIIRMSLFMDNDYVKSSVKIQKILIIALLLSISLQSEHNFFQFWSGRVMHN